MDGSAPLILLIEDEPQMRRFLRTTLSANGYAVLEAESGEDALAQASSWNPELVLLDLARPLVLLRPLA